MIALARQSGGMTDFLSLHKDIAVNGIAWSADPAYALCFARIEDAEAFRKYLRLDSRVEAQLIR